MSAKKAKAAKASTAERDRLAEHGKPAAPETPPDIAKRQKANDTKPPEQKTQLMNGASGHIMKVRSVEDLMFIETHTGDIHVIPKDRVSNLFRRVDEFTIKYGDKGYDHPPEHSEDYVTVEEIEDLITEMNPDVRQQAELAQSEDERRAERGIPREERTITGELVSGRVRA